MIWSPKPLLTEESVARYGPIVMNTNEELQVVPDEYKQGTLTKRKEPGAGVLLKFVVP
jgi:redox-sensitive bicupin YhaK (pirin superfamily)